MNKENEPYIITVIQDLFNISALVNTFFKDEKKTTQWMNTKNHLLGDLEPIEMIFQGRTDKLKKCINGLLEENER